MQNQNEQPTTDKFNPRFWVDQIEKIEYEYQNGLATGDERARELLGEIDEALGNSIDEIEAAANEPRKHVWVTVYDDVDGKTFDQYTVAITREGQPTEWYGMSYNANWPNGFNQCIEQIGDEFLATQKIIPSWDWPDGLTAGIKQRIES